jgi:hypothetical protein
MPASVLTQRRRSSTVATTDTCSTISLAIGEDIRATAPTAQTWIVIEQPGPWGNRALTESRLDPDLGAALVSATAQVSTTVVLARSLSEDPRAAQRVWFAHTSPGGVRMRVAELADLTVLRDLDFAALSRGELPGIGAHSTEPLLFVCTNGKRDACCAVKGREVIRELRASAQDGISGAVFEVSHLGGHRFAPTALLLPHGTVYGRINADDAVQILRSARQGQLHRQGYRGRSTWLGSEQAAEIAVRDQAGITGLEDLDVLRVVIDALGREHVRPGRPSSETSDQAVAHEVRHRDGRAWRVLLTPQSGGSRPESCGAAAVPSSSWAVDDLHESSSWH